MGITSSYNLRSKLISFFGRGHNFDIDRDIDQSTGVKKMEIAQMELFWFTKLVVNFCIFNVRLRIRLLYLPSFNSVSLTG